MAQAFGQDPYALRDRWSDEQLLVALFWIDGLTEMNRPSRADHYIIRLIQEVHGIFGAKVPKGYGQVSFEERVPIDITALPPDFPRPMTPETIARVHNHWRSQGMIL